MAIARIKVWVAGEVLTASDLNGEFNNILNNALSLISPLTANLALGGFSLTGLGAGTITAPSLSFTSDANTGFWSPSADQVSLSAGGATAFTVVGRVAGTAYAEFKRDAALGDRFYPVIAFGGPDDGVMSITAGTVDIAASGRRVFQASAYTNATNYLRFTPRDTGAGPLIDVAGADTNIDLNLGTKGSGVIRAATAFIPANLTSNPPPQYALVQQNTPAAWVVFSGRASSASIYASYNVTSVTRDSVGLYTINWRRTFKQASAYAVFITATSEADAIFLSGMVRTNAGGPLVGSVQIHIIDTANAAHDAAMLSVLAFGDQN